MTYSDSSLVTFAQFSPNIIVKNNRMIDVITICTMGGNLSVEGCAKVFGKTHNKGSAHYGIDSNGNIGQYVHEQDIAISTSSDIINAREISIIVASTISSPSFPISDLAYDSLVKLLTDICARNKIDALKWKNDRTLGINVANGGSTEEQNIFVRQWIENLDCPGEYLINKMYNIASDVNNKLLLGHFPSEISGSTVNSDNTEYNNKLGTITIPTNVDISTTSPLSNTNYLYMNPYVVTLMRYSNIDFSALVDTRIDGGIIEAGYLFDNLGNRVKNFRNPNVYNQVEGFKNLNKSYGYYMPCRAKSVRDAKDEIYELSFIVRKYPPTIGVWLKLELTNSIDVNDNLLEVYKNQLYRLGLYGKIGLYVDYNALSKITWDKFCNEFALWIIDHVDNLSKLDKISDNSFYKISQ